MSGIMAGRQAKEEQTVREPKTEGGKNWRPGKTGIFKKVFQARKYESPASLSKVGGHSREQVF